MMGHGFGGTYLGRVVDNLDPIDQHRLRVLVPEVFGEDAAWAAASTPPGEVAVPAVDDLVWVSFEFGNSEYPVWHVPSAAVLPDDRPAGERRQALLGVFRARVVDVDDPLGERRLRVVIPSLGDEPAWAAPGDATLGWDLPSIDAEVWIEFDHGDPAYPRWVGVA